MLQFWYKLLPSNKVRKKSGFILDILKWISSLYTHLNEEYKSTSKTHHCAIQFCIWWWKEVQTINDNELSWAAKKISSNHWLDMVGMKQRNQPTLGFVLIYLEQTWTTWMLALSQWVQDTHLRPRISVFNHHEKKLAWAVLQYPPFAWTTAHFDMSK